MKKLLLLLLIIISLNAFAQPGTIKKISELPEAGAVNYDSLQFPIAISEVTKKVYAYQLLNYIISGITRDDIQSGYGIKIDSLGPNLFKIRADSTFFDSLMRANIAAVTSVTYSQLSTLISGNGLVTGKAYNLTNFRTVYKVYGATDTTSGAVEPLVLIATSNNTLSPIAYSPSNPNDIINYSFTDNTTLSPAGGSRGVIVYRKDVINNLSAYYDWRVVKWRRWALTSGSLYYAFVNTTPAIADSAMVLTFGTGNTDCTIGSNSWNVTIGNNNTSISIGSEVGSPGAGVDIGNSNHGITIDSKCANVSTTGSGYIGGIWIGNTCTYINIGKRSYNIAIGSSCYAIDLGLQNNDISIAPSTLRGRLEKGYSNFPVTVPLTSKTIDLYNTTIYALSPYLYNSAHYCGIVNLTSSNTTDTLEKISDQTTSIAYSDIQIRPQAGLSLLVTDQANGSVSGRNFYNSGHNVVVDGTNRQYVQVYKRINNTLSSQPDSFYLSYTNVPEIGTTYTASNGLVIQGANIKIKDTGTASGIMYNDAKHALRVGADGSGGGWDYANLGTGSFSVGSGGIASGTGSMTQGSATASGIMAFAGGPSSSAIGRYSLAHGWGIKAFNLGQLSCGTYNDTTQAGSPSSTTDSNKVFDVGFGTANNLRHSTLTTRGNGNVGLKDVLYPTEGLDGTGSNIKTDSLKADVVMQGDYPVKPYKIYRALMTQSGTSAPIATVLENTIGTVTFTYSAAGLYYATSSGLFTAGKTWVNCNVGQTADGIPNGSYAIIKYNNSSNISLFSVMGDDELEATSIEIIVYQ